MITLQQLKSEALKIGAVVVVGDYNNYDQSTRIEVESPNGFKWAETGTQIIHAFKFRYDKESSGLCYADLLNKITFGIEPLTEEDL